jgi:hypothetical protein
MFMWPHVRIKKSQYGKFFELFVALTYSKCLTIINKWQQHFFKGKKCGEVWVCSRSK